MASWVIILQLLLLVLTSDLQAKTSFAKELGLVGTKANNFNGAVAESFVRDYMKSNGYGSIDAEVGRNGIDGLFYKKRNGKMEVTIIESKFGLKAKLAKTKIGKQMSKLWKLRAIDNKIKNLLKTTNNKKLIKDLEAVRAVIQNGKDQALLFKMIPLEQELSELKKRKKHQIVRLETLEKLESEGKLVGNYRTSLQELDSDGKVTNRSLKHHGLDGREVGINPILKKGDKNHKLQLLLIHSQKKEALILKEKELLKKLQSKSSKRFITKDARLAIKTKIRKQKEHIIKIKNSTKTINLEIEKNRLVAESKLSNVVKNKALVFKGKVRSIVFTSAGNLKLKNVSKSAVVMVVIESGMAVYSVLKGSMNYKKVSKLLVSSGKVAATQVFLRGLVFVTPPPGTLFVIASLAGTVIVEYSIDKYVEMDNRSFVGLEDMLWAVPDEIKNKLTILNIEDVKRNTILEMDSDNSTIINLEVDDDSEISNNESILDILE